MTDDEEEFIIDGDIVNGTFSSRAPKVKLNSVRLLFRDTTVNFFFKVFLFLFLVGGGVFMLWSKVAGSIFLILAVVTAIAIWRYISLRRIEYQNAVLCPGIVVSQSPPTVLILANMSCGGAGKPIWGVKMEESRSFKPFPTEIGQRIPCVTAFQGSGFGECWDRMISSPLTSGTGNKKKLQEALSRLNDEEEWRVLEFAIQQERFPEGAKTLRL